jgi:ribonuclease HI
MITIYTDGACCKDKKNQNTGNGGWAAIIFMNGQKIIKRGYTTDTTANRMEITAAVRILDFVLGKGINEQITLKTDSQYLRLGITKWINVWKKNGWLTTRKEPVRNKDLWVKLNLLISNLNVRFEWVKSHSGIRYNEEVDKVARKESKKAVPNYMGNLSFQIDRILSKKKGKRKRYNRTKGKEMNELNKHLGINK